MVIAENKFIWLHFGKTAGTTCRDGLLRLFPDAFCYPDNDPLKHGNLSTARSGGLDIPEGVPVLLGVRRLESWVDSHLREQFFGGAPVDVREQTIDGRLILGEQSKAREIGLFEGVETLDDLIRYYCSDREVIFIRNEYLAKDFTRFFKSRFPNMEKEEIRQAFHGRKNVKKNQGGSILTSEELTRLSAACPLWKSLESKLYSRSIFRGYRQEPVKI